MSFSITSLTIYPVKSLAGIPLTEARVGKRGLEHDREWMIVSEGGQFITQRELAPLALIHTAIDDKHLTLSLPNDEQIKVDLISEDVNDAAASVIKKAITVKVWKDTCEAFDEGDDAAAILSTYLKRKVRLVRMKRSFERPLDERYRTSDGDTVGFADDFPVLVISDESLKELNSKLEFPVPMNRFRPNITIGGTSPFAEDDWQDFATGEGGKIKMSVVKPCARCLIVTIDQETAEASVEPLRTLSYFRKQDGKIMFGQNAIPYTFGALRVGDTVNVTLR
jgi:uncharacterized protein YcbX